MDTKNVSTEKRPRDGEASISESNKKIKIDTNNQSTQIGDLNDNCLIQIFQHLSMNDLVNIVDYDNRVSNAAQFVFNKKFADNCFTISNRLDRKNEKVPWSVTLLKHFGAIIKKLHVVYDERYRRIDMLIDNTIISHCRKSLVEIKFENADSFTMYDINEPFENVLVVSFVRSKFCDLISNFGKWFPMAHTLHLHHQPRQDYDERRMLESHLPALKHFKIWNTQDKKVDVNAPEGRINNYNIAAFLKLNPQLESVLILFDDYDDVTADNRLALASNRRQSAYMYSSAESSYNERSFGPLHGFDGIVLDREILAIIKSDLKNLENLNLIFDHESPGIPLQNVLFDKLKTLTIYYRNTDTLKNVLISTNSVDSLHLIGPQINANCIKFIKHNSSVKSLKIKGRYVADAAQQLINLAPTLSSLKELYLPYQNRAYSSASIGKVLGECKLLTRCTIVTVYIDGDDKQAIYQELRSIANTNLAGWRSTVKDGWSDYGQYRIMFEKN